MKMFVPRKIKFPEEIAKIRRAIERRGTLNLNDVELELMWSLFSEKHYCAGFLTYEVSYVKEFINFIEDKNVSALDEILENAEEN